MKFFISILLFLIIGCSSEKYFVKDSYYKDYLVLHTTYNKIQLDSLCFADSIPTIDFWEDLILQNSGNVIKEKYYYRDSLIYKVLINDQFQISKRIRK